jgi:hypothetical protein
MLHIASCKRKKEFEAVEYVPQQRRGVMQCEGCTVRFPRGRCKRYASYFKNNYALCGHHKGVPVERLMICERSEEDSRLLELIRESLMEELEQPVYEDEVQPEYEDEDDDIEFCTWELNANVEESIEPEGHPSNDAMEIWEDEVCSICLETLFSPSVLNSLIETKCKHRFHASCLTSWIQGPSSSGELCCPNCRQQIGEPYTEEVVGSPVIIKKMSCLKFK